MRISTNMFHSNGLVSIQNHQKDVLDIQQKLSSGKRINVAGDGPVALNQIHSLSRMIDNIDQFAKNGNYAKSQLIQEETAMTDSINSLQRARELGLQVMNGSYNEQNRLSAAVEIDQIIQQVSNMMNYSNSEGDKIFAGNSTDAPLAYVNDVVNPGYKSYIGHANSGTLGAGDARENPDNLYDELANYGSRFVQIGFDSDNNLSPSDEGDPSRIRVTDNGSKVFSIPNVNTQFQTALPYVTTEVTPTTVEADTLKFYPMTEGQTLTVAGLTYTANTVMTENQVAAAFSNLADGAVTGSGTGTGAYSGALTNWSSGAVGNDREVVFDTTTGVAGENVADITVSKTDVYPPEHNILNVLIEFKRDLENNDVSNISDYIKDIDGSISQISLVRAEIGGRQNRVESQFDAGEAFKVTLEARRSEIEDMDIVEGITDLTKSQNALQMAQQVFTKVQAMTLFDYLR